MITKKTITLTDRGQQREFVITEMGVWKLQKVLLRIGCELVKTGILAQETNDALQMTQSTLKAIQHGGLEKLGNLNPDAAMAILADMLECVEFKVGNLLTPLNEQNVEQYIEDIGTLWMLGKEVFAMHFSFLQSAIASIFPQASLQEKGDAKGAISKPKMYLRS